MSGPQIPDLPLDVIAAMQRAAMPDFDRFREMVNATGGCAQPIRLKGERTTIDAQTGEVIESYSTADEPTGYLLTACGNRRASRCPACAEVYRDDTYHLIIAGMQGGKGVPEGVSAHPRVFASLTAPSFGAVHTHREKGGKVLSCRPRRDGPLCPHGRPDGCGRRHQDDDPATGQPICVDCYDYAGAVLWNAHAAELWRRFMLALPKHLAAMLGITRKAFRDQARIGYARVIEYQRRGSIHFHAVLRVDGPDGPADPPPAWASPELLSQAIRSAADAVTVSVPALDECLAPLTFEWGRQLDVQPVYVSEDLEGIKDKNVARYIAKYATKGAEASGTVDRPIRHPRQLTEANLSPHARRMIWTCLQLAHFPQYADLRLRQWAHMLGYGGHFSTKSRLYSTTLTALRQQRADYQAAQDDQHNQDDAGQPERSVITMSQWKYAGSGYLHGEKLWADVAYERIRTARAIRRSATEREQQPKAS